MPIATETQNRLAGLAKQSENGKGQFAELGVTGLKQSSGLVDEERTRQLQGDKWPKIAREMAENDEVVGAVLTAIEMLVRQVDWRTQPASNDNVDLEAAQFLSETMADMSHTWEDFIAEVLSELVYGWEYTEIVYKRRNGPSRAPGQSSRHTDGKIGIRKLPIRSQDSRVRWLFDDEGGVQGMVQQDPNSFNEIPIPIERALLFRTTNHKGSPEGMSLLRRAWLAWYFKKRIREIEAVGIERDMAGVVKGYAPEDWFHSTANTAQKAALQSIKDMVVNLRRDELEGLLLPSMFDENNNRLVDITLMGSGGQRQFDTDKVVNRYDRGIAGSMLADFILLGHEKVGSFALSSDKTALFAVALGSVMDGIKAVLNRHLVPRLFALNGAPVGMLLPEFVHGDIEKVDLGEFTEAVQRLTASGMPLFPDADVEQHIKGMLNLPTEQVEGEL